MRVKQTQRKPSKIIFIIIVSILVVGAIGGITYALISNNANNSQSTDTTQSNSDTDGTDSKQDLIENGDTPAEPASDPSIELTLTQDSQQVTVSSKLHDYSDGTCTLKVNQGTNNYSDSAPVIFQSEFSTCAGFSVPISELGKGTWSVSLSVESAGKTTTKTDKISVK